MLFFHFFALFTFSHKDFHQKCYLFIDFDEKRNAFLHFLCFSHFRTRILIKDAMFSSILVKNVLFFTHFTVFCIFVQGLSSKMQCRFAIQICNTDMPYRYAIQICNTDMQQRYAIKICNTDMQHRYATKICNTDMQYRYAIQIRNADMQQIYVR